MLQRCSASVCQGQEPSASQPNTTRAIEVYHAHGPPSASIVAYHREEATVARPQGRVRSSEGGHKGAIVGHTEYGDVLKRVQSTFVEVCFGRIGARDSTALQASSRMSIIKPNATSFCAVSH